MMTHLWTVLVLLVLAPSSGWGLTADEISKFGTNDVVEYNTGKRGYVKVTLEGDDIRLRSNGIPDHDTGPFPFDHNPNSIKEQNNDMLIPNNPKHANEPTCLPEGPIGFAKNGVAIYNPYSGFAVNAVEGPDKEVFDLCEGHPSPDGMYHYHHEPVCVHEGELDEFIGVAVDGFPIYGSKNSSGYILTSDDLDDCNGHYVNGKYRYRVTKDFPYVMGCFKGEITLTEKQLRKCYFVHPDGHGKKPSESSATSIYTSFCAISALLLTLIF